MTQTDVTAREFHNTLQVMENSLERLRTMINLIVVAAEHDPVALDSPAIAELVLNPLAISFSAMEGFRELINRETVAETIVTAPVVYDPNRLGDAEQRIIDLIKSATPAREPVAEPGTAPADLRDRLIAEQHRAGVDAAVIAQAMNLRRSAVDRVVSQLTAGDGDQADTISQAVNS